MLEVTLGFRVWNMLLLEGRCKNGRIVVSHYHVEPKSEPERTRALIEAKTGETSAARLLPRVRFAFRSL